MFVTAYDTYALEAFEVSAVDYLLKPFDQERFRKTLARVRPRHAKSGADERQALLAGLLAQLERGARAAGEERPRLLAEFGGHLHVLDVDAGGNDRGGPQLRRHPGRAGTTTTRAAPCSRRSWRCARNPCCASAAPVWST